MDRLMMWVGAEAFQAAGNQVVASFDTCSDTIDLGRPAYPFTSDFHSLTTCALIPETPARSARYWFSSSRVRLSGEFHAVTPHETHLEHTLEQANEEYATLKNY